VAVAITFAHDESGGYPVIECDWCGQQREDVEEGNVLWIGEGLGCEALRFCSLSGSL
jgi:hypothetical protein